jgi:hypothetical protein
VSDCIEYPYGKTKDGYGRARHEGRDVYAHRLAFFRLHGWWPEVVRHTCDNPPCWNQTHLVAGTKADNSRDMRERGRSSPGTGRPQAELTEEIVREARLRYEAGAKILALANEFGVTRMVMSRAIRKKTWRHVA